ncbi:TetR/AcrR family transcriptional regulator [Actinoplanes subtropicus]|uniref:TetR/AcrR family transcriptional regulator n=1 Tax=Actinoplanes subtropicus TaxID=543632 RepID=UPI001B808FD9|nr:TetR/AcrR family transcriptional regulator [Actinoplanes subtropicus]
MALLILDEHGADALSMRTLAQRLDSSTATLYRHFAGRPDLIAQVIDRMFGKIDVDPGELGTVGWSQACRQVAHQMFDVLRRHGNVAHLLVEQVPVGPNAMVLRERLVAILLDGGFPPPLAARSYATVARFVLAFALQPGDPGALEGDRAASVSLHTVDPARFPATTAVADWMPVPVEEEFAFGLDLLLRGLATESR